MNNALRRIGALIPPGNVTVEREFSRFAPAGVHVHYNRLYRPTVSVDKEGLLSMINSAEQAARGLAQANPEAIVYACTSGSFLSGPGREDEIGDKIRRWTGIPLLILGGIVIATVPLLYYAGSDTVRALASDLHLMAGVAVPALLLAHRRPVAR